MDVPGWVITSGSAPEPVAPADRLALARHGASDQRWRPAGEADLDDEVYEASADGADESIASVLAMNTATPGHVLRRLAQEWLALAEFARANANAPVDLKEESRLSSHGDYSIGRYLEDKQASVDVWGRHLWARFMELFYRVQASEGGPTVAQAWRTANQVKQLPR